MVGKGIFLLDLATDQNLSEDFQTEIIGMAALKNTGSATKSDIASLTLWHRRLAHVGVQALGKIIQITNGVPYRQEKCECDDCICCKLVRKPFSPATADLSPIPS